MNKLLMIDPEGIEAVKRAIGYTNGQAPCCQNCLSSILRFDKVESGSPQTSRLSCGINAFELPVDSTGCCNHWSEIQPIKL